MARKDRSAAQSLFGAIASVFRPPRNPFARKTRTIAPTGIVWDEKLAQSLHRKVCGAKTSHNHPTGKSVGRKPRTITPTGSLWSENLAQSPQRESCGAKDSHNRPNGKSVALKPRTIAPTKRLSGEILAQTPQREVCGLKTSHNRPNETVLGRKTCSIARHGSVSAGCPPQDFRDFMAEPQPEAFGRCFGKRWPIVGLGLPTRSVIQDFRREMLPFCDLPSPLEKCGSVF